MVGGGLGFINSLITIGVVFNEPLVLSGTRSLGSEGEQGHWVQRENKVTGFRGRTRSLGLEGEQSHWV